MPTCKLYGLLENDRFQIRAAGQEWQAYTLAPPLFATLGSACTPERDNIAAVMRACEAISNLDPRYRFSRERVTGERGWASQLVAVRQPRSRNRLGPPARAQITRPVAAVEAPRVA